MKPKLTVEEENTINKIRLSLGLEVLEDYYKKAIYEFSVHEIKEFYFPKCHLNIFEQQSMDIPDFLEPIK